jgi:hypothetical protein
MGITGFRTPQTNPVSCGSLFGTIVIFFYLLLMLSFPVSALALDGRIELRGTQQDGGAGETAYETNTLWENYSLGQHVPLAKNFMMQLDFVTRRQTLESQSYLGGSDSEVISYLPNASLTFRSDEFRIGLNASASRKDHSGSNLQSWRDEHAAFNAWLRQKWSWLALDASLMESSSQRESDLDSRDTREHYQNFGVRVNVTKKDEVRYSFTHNSQDLRTYNTNTTFYSHNLQYRGSHDFFSGRGRISVDARTDLMKQISTYGQEGGLEYLPPIWGGYTLDDTPEELDPLEPDPVLTPGLYNKDRDTPTNINIGDSAPVVRLYGGDYRNIIFDFGDTESMDEIFLYVDTVLRFPDLMQWRVFTSDDPEGRDWSNELNSSQFTATWTELENGRQGWRFSLPTTINHRRVKVVNYKLGLTEPNILITEMEVHQILGQDGQDIEQTVRRQRLQGDLSFALASNLNVIFSTTLSGRHYQETDRDVTGAANRLGANWTLGTMRLAASHEVNQVRNSTEQNTDANSQRASLSNRFSRNLQARLSYAQTDDQSWTLRHKSQTMSGDVTWRVAPRLTFIQKVSYGTRDASSLGVESESWTLGTTIRGRPRPSLEMELRRNDRWVSQEAGADFSTFNNTQLQTTWAIFPLLTLTSQIIYQVREEDDILVRNSVVWTPLPGGSVSIRLHANDFQDTRTDWFQRGAGGLLTWRPRPRLYLEGGIEWVLIKQYDERNTPTNVQFRGSWSF